MIKVSGKLFGLQILAGLLLCCVEASAMEPPKAIDDKILSKNPTPLMGMTSVDDFATEFEEPNAHEGGGIEMQRYFSTAVVLQLKNCRDAIDAVFIKWYQEQGLIPSQRLETKETLTVRIFDKENKGLFEAGYVFNTRPTYVRASLDYYDLSGNKLAPEVIEPLLVTYKLDSLWDDLSGALKCE